MPVSRAAARLTLGSAITVMLVAALLPVAIASWEEGILSAHNAARAKNGVAPLKWNDKLSSTSFEYASRCREHFSATTAVDYGEVWYSTAGMPSTQSREDPVAQTALKKAVPVWMQGRQAAQIIAEGIKNVGCGFAACPNGTTGGWDMPYSGPMKNATIVICRYF